MGGSSSVGVCWRVLAAWPRGPRAHGNIDGAGSPRGCGERPSTRRVRPRRPGLAERWRCQQGASNRPAALAVDKVEDERSKERAVYVGEQRGGRGGAAAALLGAEEEGGEGHVQQDRARHDDAQPLRDEAVARGWRRREAAQQVVTVDPVGAEAKEEAQAVERWEGRAVDQRHHHHLVNQLRHEGATRWGCSGVHTQRTCTCTCRTPHVHVQRLPPDDARACSRKAT